MWIYPIRRRTRLRLWRKRAKRGRRDERAVEARAEIVLRWWWRWRLLLLLLLLLLLAGVCGGVGLSRCLGVAQFDGRCERGWWRGAKRVAVGWLASRDLRLLRIV
jgi:hypothetical protein